VCLFALCMLLVFVMLVCYEYFSLEIGLLNGKKQSVISVNLMTVNHSVSYFKV
jgi:hypothetical protein